MKYVLCTGLIAGFGVIGLCIRSHLSQRVQFYNELMSFVDRFVINVNFIQTNFIECLNEVVDKGGILSKLFEYYKTKFIEGREVEKLKLNFLSDSEVNEVFNLLNSIGLTDLENQIAILKGERIKLEEKLHLCLDLLKKYGGMSIKLSVIFGCLIALILI